VVSGLALGIDAAAHLGALEAGGAPPVAVVASGLDVVYPRANATLWNRVASSGVVITEAPLGTRPERWRFPARNRTIAALADVVVVVESHRQGGAAITARLAMDQGRTVLAVPGPVHSPASEGCHDLIADGAGIYRGIDDAVVALGMSPGARRAATDGRTTPDGVAAEVLEAVGWQPVALAHLVTATGRTPGEVAEALDDLVAAQWLTSRAGWFERRLRGT
jgi:DNA processing protein